MRKILETGKNGPMSLLYFETGHLPARFQIEIIMLNFLHYILQLERDFLMSKFFKAQSENPTKGDWVSNVKKIQEKKNLNLPFEEKGHMKKHTYQKLDSEKVKARDFSYFLCKVKTKGKLINNNNLFKCQGYLLQNNFLNLKEHCEIFSYYARMNKLNGEIAWNLY